MATLQPLTINQPDSHDALPDIKHIQSSRPDNMSDDARTPTRDSFAAANGKRTLPMSPTAEEPPPEILGRDDLRREGSHRSSNSQVIQDQDVDMLGSEDEGEGSENDSQDDDTERPSKKKKKGQRFFCTEYPPCNLSFTRSEHLARHIRKHTGERPFQCHCSRRFSRLDNLRQHAQTVHVNEDIPNDSLAATGTRFQRQIRTDRVRPAGLRARASTAGSQSGPRGHGRNLSTSSIASTTSNVSTISSVGTLSRENSGRRPHSMTLSEQRRGGLTIDTLRASPTRNYAYVHQSGSGNSTPTSYYAGTPSSPYGSTLASPIALSRNPASDNWGERHARRLSVPSGTSVFQQGPPPQYHNPQQPPSSSYGSNDQSVAASPTSSTFSIARTEVGPEDWRRRTWHPTTYSNYSYPRPATSGLSYSQTPNEPRPAFAPQALTAAGQTTKLPGIEAFDQMSGRPATPPQHMPPPNAAITPGRLSLFPSVDRRQPGHGHIRGVHSWDMSLHQNLTRLEINGSGTPPREVAGWVQQQQQQQQQQQEQHPPERIIHQQQHHPQQYQQTQPTQHHQRQQSIDQAGSLQSSPQRLMAQPQYAPTPTPVQGQQVPVPPQLVLPSQPATGPVSQDSSQYQLPTPPTVLPSNDRPQAVSQRTSWSSVPHKLMRGPSQASAGSSSGDSINTPAGHPDFRPTIIHANGYIEPQPNVAGPKYSLFPASQQARHRQGEYSQRPDTSGLDALVAVATSESQRLPPSS